MNRKKILNQKTPMRKEDKFEKKKHLLIPSNLCQK